jgi:hypothetical protein
VDAALAGLLGAAVGAVSGLGGSWLSARLGQNQEQVSWRRAKTEEAYTQCIHALLLMVNMRSRLGAGGGMPYLSEDDIPKWLANIVEARYWLTAVTIFCSEDSRARLAPHEQALSDAVEHLMRGDFRVDKRTREPEGLAVVRPTLAAVVDAARRDIGVQFARP